MQYKKKKNEEKYIVTRSEIKKNALARTIKVDNHEQTITDDDVTPRPIMVLVRTVCHCSFYESHVQN